MPDLHAPPRVVLSPAARRDMRQALKWSEERFGKQAALRYQALLVQALKDLMADPERPGSQERADLAKGVRAYHLRFSRDRAKSTHGVVHNPRHFIIYRCRPDRDAIDVVRILHDARELERHMPKE